MNIPSLANKRIVLASASLRRSEILKTLGLPFIVAPSTFEEDLDKRLFSDPGMYALETANQKASEVLRRESDSPDLIISADTIISHQGDILEKPSSKEHAAQILSRLSGTAHDVLTAVVLLSIDKTTSPISIVKKEFVEKTTVEFMPLSNEMIASYIESGEPMDKAGAYGYQGLARYFVKKINGCYYNVIGFPANRFLVELLALQNTD